MKKGPRKKSPKKSLPKEKSQKDEIVPAEENPFDFGGLANRNLKKGLGC